MIINKTNGNTISEQEMVCKTVMSQALGLMFRQKKNLIMIFPKEKVISLHMFFVFYPINVLVLDKDKRIVEIKRNFKPFTFWKSKEKGKYAVEVAMSGRYIVGDALVFN